MPERALNTRQQSALIMIGRGYLTTYAAASAPSLVKRGLVTDHGRWWGSRGHTRRYELTEAGRATLRTVLRKP